MNDVELKNYSELRLQVQPDPASCMITAIAMIINEPVEELILKINGEDNPRKHLSIIHPGREKSMKYRGFHVQDFTDYLEDIGWCISLNYARVPLMHPYFKPKMCLMCGGSGKFKGRWEEYNLRLEGNEGILQYNNHSCAWIDDMVYNPCGKIEEFYTTGLIGFHRMYRIDKLIK